MNGDGKCAPRNGIGVSAVSMLLTTRLTHSRALFLPGTWPHDNSATASFRGRDATAKFFADPYFLHYVFPTAELGISSKCSRRH